MAVTQNTYTGDGATVLFSFTFPYLETTDIKVSVGGTITTAYTLANATTIEFNTAPANGAAIRIFRQTDDADLAATFYPGSAIRSQDLNENFTQNLYVTQESSRDATEAIDTAEGAVTTANSATATANTALSTANTASSNASAAVSTANTASSNASAAVSTANTASSNASAAVSTANSAVSTANSATSTANTALSTANAASSTATTASSNATSAVSTANSALSAANSAVSTANTASSNASTALSTANTAASNASTAVSTANSAASTANSAAAAVASAVLYQPVVDLTALALLTPADGDFFELQDSTGADTDPSITGVPVGLVGAAGLTFRLRYDDPPGEYVFLGYFANDSETRYLKTGTGTVTSTNILDGTIVNADVNASAAIAGTKVAPDFGSQNVVTTGTATAASLNPTGSSVPTNGIHLPAPNTVGISTNGVEQLQVNSPGQLLLNGLGNATAPAFSWMGDPDTGIYRPGADQVAISTNGTGRLFVDASGRVGLGVANLTRRLEIESTTANLALTGTSNSYIDYVIGGSNIGIVGDANWTFGGSSSDLGLRATSNLVFGIGATERMRLTSAGLLGLGTSSVDTLLHLSLTSAPGDKIRAQGANNTDLRIGDHASNNGGYYINSQAANQDLRFRTQGTDRVTITSTGVGIGVTSPATNLHVFGAGASSRLENSSATTSTQFTVKNTVGTVTLGLDSSTGGGFGAANAAVLWYDAAQPLVFATNNTERARIDSSGRLLVGTSSTSVATTAILQGSSAGTTADAELKLARGLNNPGDGATLSALAFSDSSHTNSAVIFASRDGGTWSASSKPTRLVFSTTADGASSPTERFRINNGGTLYSANNSVYLGTENPVMAGGGAFTAHGDFFNGTPGAAFSTTDNTNGAIYVQFGNSSGTKIGSITRASSTSVAYNTTSDYRLKENVLPIQAATQLIRQLKPVSYNFVGHTDEQSTGFIAHELQGVIPEAVTGEKDATYADGSPNYQGVDLSKLVPLLTAALQEALQKIETLEQRLIDAGIA